jgi:hypothetical protein
LIDSREEFVDNWTTGETEELAEEPEPLQQALVDLLFGFKPSPSSSASVCSFTSSTASEYNRFSTRCCEWVSASSLF